jgi:probable F420-dependent oxidoreductase
MPRPFRFGVQIHHLPATGWAERVRRIESLGFSTLFFPDHFGTQWEPMTALAAIAAATTRLRVGSLVYDVDYRHPVIYAKGAATLHLLSGGRHEFGIGAGWMKTDYDEAGVAYDSAGTRIERLDEALRVIRAMWANERTTFEGKHYRVRAIAQAAELPKGERPPILIGGGGPRLLRLAARHADIVGINPALPEGRVTPETPRDMTPERLREKIGWVREAAAKAGRDPDALELNSLTFLVAIGPAAGAIREGMAKNLGMTLEEVAASPLFITGSPAEVRDRLEKRREEFGLSYVVIQGDRDDVVDSFAEHVVAPLAGR